MPHARWLSPHLRYWTGHKPLAVALVSGSEVWSYRELLIHTNTLAEELATRLSPGDLVALDLTENPWSVPACLALDSVGAAVVPLPRELPDELSTRYLRRSGCGARLTIAEGGRVSIDALPTTPPGDPQQRWFPRPEEDAASSSRHGWTVEQLIQRTASVPRKQVGRGVLPRNLDDWIRAVAIPLEQGRPIGWFSAQKEVSMARCPGPQRDWTRSTSA